MRRKYTLLLFCMTAVLLSGCRQDRLRRRQPETEWETETETEFETETETETEDFEIVAVEELTEEETTEPWIEWVVETTEEWDEDEWTFDDETSEWEEETTAEPIDPWVAIWGYDPDEQEAEEDWRMLWDDEWGYDRTIREGEDEYTWIDIEVINNDDAPEIQEEDPIDNEDEVLIAEDDLDDAPALPSEDVVEEGEPLPVGDSPETVETEQPEDSLPIQDTQAPAEPEVSEEPSQEDAVATEAVPVETQGTPEDAQAETPVPSSEEPGTPAETPAETPAPVTETEPEPAVTETPAETEPEEMPEELPVETEEETSEETTEEETTEEETTEEETTEAVPEQDYACTFNGGTIKFQIPEGQPDISGGSRILAVRPDGTVIGESRYGEAPWSIMEDVIPDVDGWDSCSEITMPVPAATDVASMNGTIILDFLVATDVTVYTWQEEVSLNSIPIRLYQPVQQGEPIILIATPPEGAGSIEWTVSDSTVAGVPAMLGKEEAAEYSPEAGQYVFSAETLTAGSVSITANFTDADGETLAEGQVRIRIEEAPTEPETEETEETEEETLAEEETEEGSEEESEEFPKESIEEILEETTEEE